MHKLPHTQINDVQKIRHELESNLSTLDGQIKKLLKFKTNYVAFDKELNSINKKLS